MAGPINRRTGDPCRKAPRRSRALIGQPCPAALATDHPTGHISRVTFSRSAAPMTESLATVRRALADRYTVERELGRGGMATVYLAEEAKHGRQVAIKALHPELAATLGAD